MTFLNRVNASTDQAKDLAKAKAAIESAIDGIINEIANPNPRAIKALFAAIDSLDPIIAALKAK